MAITGRGYGREKKSNVIGFIILGFMFLIGLGVVLQVTGTFSFLSITPLSISNVDIIGSGSRILVYARQGGGSELSIDFTPNALNSFLEAKGFKATQSSRLTAKYIDQNIRIPFSTSETEYNAIKSFRSPQSIGFNYGRCNIQDCKNKGYTETVAAFGEGYLAGYDCYCVEDYNNGYTLSFNSGFSSRAFAVEWNLDGQTQTMTSDVTSINFGSAAIIKWQGSLLGSNTIGVPNYDVYHVGNSWYLIDKNADSRVSSAYSTFKLCVNKVSLTKQQYDTCKASYESVVNNQISSKDSNYKYEVPNVRNIDFDNGLMNVILDEPTFLSTYTIELDASKVGIVRLKGIPEITECPSKQEFLEAGSRNINFKVKNIGTTEAGFNAYTKCGTSISSNSQEFDIDAGETKSVSLLLSGGNTGTTTNRGTCTLYVKDSNSNNQDTCSFQVEVEYASGISDCVGDESTCSPDGKSRLVCVNGAYKTYACNTGTVCSYAEGKAICIVGDEDDKGNMKCESCGDFALSNMVGLLWKSKQCEPKTVLGIQTQTTFTCFFSFIKLLLIPIVLIFSILFIPGGLKRLFKDMNPGVIWTISLLLAVIATYLVFISFWIGIILAIVYVIGGTIIKSLNPF